MPPRTSPPRKRQRVSLACTNCRKRKSRCDGHRPDCSLCQELHVQCVYESLPESDKQVSREYLVRRIAELEAQLKARIPEDAEYMTQISEAGPSSPAISSTSRIGHRNASITEANDIGVDTLASGAFDDTPASNIGFFGSSSNFALFRALSHNFSQLARHSRSIAPSQAHLANGRSEPEQALRKRHEGDPSQASLLPRESELVFLLEEFGQTIGSIIPCVDVAALVEFWKGYEKDKTRVIPRSSYALVNIVVAHASAVLGRDSAFLFYHRCSNLLDMHTVQGADIETVQSLVLLSVFQQNHQRSIESWTTHSLAVKAAFQVGLHSPSYYENGTESETRKRLWFCLINQDRLLAILLGRPFLIAPQYIRMSFPEGPITIPDTPIRGSSTARFSEQGHLFRSLVGIHAIQSSAVERLYDYNIDGPSRSSPREIMTARLDLTMELDEWCESLRQNIQVVRPNDPRGEARVSAASRWSIILSVHYYVTKLLINAPILSMALSEGQKLWLGNTSFSMIHKSAEEVLNDDFESAKELQHIIQETAGARIWGLGESPIWFICNYSMFTVSLHAFGILLYIKGLGNDIAVLDSLRAKEVRLLLDNSLESLRKLGRRSLMSQKARDCLLRFLNVFDSMTLDEEVRTTVESSISGIDMRSARSQDPAELDFDFSQFITDTAEEFLFQI